MESKFNHEDFQLPQRPVAVKKDVYPVRRIVIFLACFLILAVLFVYLAVQKSYVSRAVEHHATQMVDHISREIADTVEYAKSSIKFSSQIISRNLKSEVLMDPVGAISHIEMYTPFDGIEYIRPDGMNVKNIGSPFYAYDREYYIEGMKGHTGVWSNFHPLISNDTLVNFYAPLYFEGNIAGVITGYIEANKVFASKKESFLYSKKIHGIVLDENNMVVCTTMGGEYIKDLSFDVLLNRFNLSAQEKTLLQSRLESLSGPRIIKDPQGEGRVFANNIEGTKWKLVFFLPASSFEGIINDFTQNSLIAVFLIFVILLFTSAYVLVKSYRINREIARDNAELEEQNCIFNEQNHKAFAELLKIKNITASANMGTWSIELIENKKPRMLADTIMKKLLGINTDKITPEQSYNDWFGRIKPEALPSVMHSIERMKQGFFDENTYLWLHPDKGERYVRCGGTAKKVEGGYIFSGYHYDVDKIVRDEQKQTALLNAASASKREYYSVLDSLCDIYQCMYVIDLKGDHVYEYGARCRGKGTELHSTGTIEMMNALMTEVASESCRAEALEFADLATLPSRLGDKPYIVRQLFGHKQGWFIASFIAMERDPEGMATKVLFIMRSNDAEKKQEQRLVAKLQTDELTGLYNRYAYEEDLEKLNEVHSDNLIYIALDVNGLKVTNDTKGHTAGDELIIGAARCMRESFGTYGNIYRTGGDEFAAVIYCDDKELQQVVAEFENNMAAWHGQQVDGLSIAYGYASKRENPHCNVKELYTLAEKRMYESKSAHYSMSGVDRRGQQEAHKVLCDSYQEILKLNLTSDTFQVINGDTFGDPGLKGYKSKLSEHFKWLVKSDLVHPDDRAEFKKLNGVGVYFKAGNRHFQIFYRRKYHDGYERVMTEVIPAKDFAEGNEILFLYVKKIDPERKTAVANVPDKGFLSML